MTDTALIAALSHPTFDEGFVNWLATAEMEDIECAYAEEYKGAHGIKARWVYNAGIGRVEFARMFVLLGADLKAEQERREAQDAAFMASLAALGLSQWAADNGIRCEIDLWEHNYRREWTADPEPLPYERMVPGPLAMM